MGRKSCLNCIHGSKVLNEGNSFEGFFKPYYIACACEESVGETVEKNKWNEYLLPEICNHYEPKLVERCAYCKAEINVAEYIWDIWAGINGKPTCCSDCRIKLEAAEIGNLFYD